MKLDLSNTLQHEKKHLLSKRYAMIPITLAVCLLWGSAFTMIVVGYDVLNVNTNDVFQVMLFAGMRFFIASLMIFTYAFTFKKDLRLSWRGFRKILLLGLLQTFGQYIFMFLSLRYLHPANNAVLGTLGVFLTVIFAHFYFRKSEKLSRNKVIGLLLGMTGIIVLNGFALGTISFLGEGFKVIASTLSAISGIYVKKLTREFSPVVISSYQLLFGSSLLMAIGATFASDINFTVTSTSVTALLYLGFISAAGFTIWSTLLKHNHISKISIYKFSIPVFGVLIAFIFLGESFNVISVLISLAFVASGIILINLE